MIRRLNTSDGSFRTDFAALRASQEATGQNVEDAVRDIITQVRNSGDEALLELTNRFDRRSASSLSELSVSKANCVAALEALPVEQAEALQLAAERIKAFAERQRLESWSYTDEDGSLLGQQITALDKVGVYVPGGKAAYPSSVLMNAIPAKVAGVEQVVMVVPAPDGVVNKMVLAAAAVADVDALFTVGGAQAIAALAYGTETIPAVDKIVGPGNIWVATAKRQVFGKVGIDMIAGPSEVLVISDGSVNPDWLAMDLFAQAEHDEHAQSVLLSPDQKHLDAVAEAIERLLPQMERREIITAALAEHGALIRTQDIEQAIELSNEIAPEHLELALNDAADRLAQIKHAGAIFAGPWSAEVFGDYCAGPNHVLPTSRTARFSSPLGVYDFQKRTSVLMTSECSADKLGRIASVMARGEGLTAHARSAEYRTKQ